MKSWHDYRFVVSLCLATSSDVHTGQLSLEIGCCALDYVSRALPNNANLKRSEWLRNFDRMCSSLKVLYVGPIKGHGSTLGVSGSAFVRLVTLSGVKTLSIICPVRNKNDYEPEAAYPAGVEIFECYREGDPLSLIGASLRVLNAEADVVLFNLFPTSQGQNIIANMFWNTVPLLSRLSGKKSIVIWHNSVITSDYKNLGYGGMVNEVKAFFFQLFEKLLFRLSSTCVLLEYYRDEIFRKTGSKVLALPLPFIDAISLLESKGLINHASSFIRRESPEPLTVHLHGNWGPQKDLVTILNMLNRLRSEGQAFRLLISGSINTNFPEYETGFNSALDKFRSIITKVTMPISSSELFDSLLDTDIVILPYKAPGGRSGIMDMAAFLKCAVICPDFPEYREQASFYEGVRLVNWDGFEEAISEELIRHKVDVEISIDVKEEVRRSIRIMRDLLEL